MPSLCYPQLPSNRSTMRSDSVVHLSLLCKKYKFLEYHVGLKTRHIATIYSHRYLTSQRGSNALINDKIFCQHATEHMRKTRDFYRVHINGNKFLCSRVSVLFLNNLIAAACTVVLYRCNCYISIDPGTRFNCSSIIISILFSNEIYLSSWWKLWPHSGCSAIIWTWLCSNS